MYFAIDIYLVNYRYKSLEVVFYLMVGICPAYAVRHMVGTFDVLFVIN